MIEVKTQDYLECMQRTSLFLPLFLNRDNGTVGYIRKARITEKQNVRQITGKWPKNSFLFWERSHLSTDAQK